MGERDKRQRTDAERKDTPFAISLRIRETQVWNDYLNSEFQRGLEDVAQGRIYTAEEAKRCLAEIRSTRA